MATTAMVEPKGRMAVPCHACLSTDNDTYLQARGYRIAECRKCGLWFVSPQPTHEELEQYYATYDSGDLWRDMEEGFNRSVRSTILERKQSGKVLDVGCGSGNFLRCMKEKGFSVRNRAIREWLRIRARRSSSGNLPRDDSGLPESESGPPV